VRIMSLDEGDTVVAVVRVPPEEQSEPQAVPTSGEPPATGIAPSDEPPPESAG